MKKQRGRKAGVGTVEAREFVKRGLLGNWLDSEEIGLSKEGRERIVKATKFGLGIKETKTGEE